MRNADYKRAFGSVDPAFERRVHQTLRKLREQEDRPMNRKMSAVVALVAALCLLLAGLAVAASNMGLLEYLKQRTGAAFPDEIEQLIERPANATGVGEFATFTVNEAIYDGNTVHIMVEAVPRDDVLLVIPLTSPEDRMSSLGKAFAGRKERIEEYVKANGKTGMYVVNFGTEDNETCFISSIDGDMQLDGRMIVELTGEVAEGAGSELPITLRCKVIKHGSREIHDTLIPFVLTTTPTTGTMVSDEPVVFEDVGTRVDHIEITGSAMKMTAIVQFTILDRTKWTDSLDWDFTFLDENGERIQRNVGGLDYTRLLDDERPYTRYEQHTTLPTTGEMPTEITLAGENTGIGKLYKAHTIKLRPKTEP